MTQSFFSKRVVFSIFLFLSIFVFPWWVTIAFSIFGIFLFGYFYEALIVGVFIDTLYGGTSGKFLSDYPATIGISILFLISFLLKENFSFYK